MDKAVEAAVKNLKKNSLKIKTDDYESINHVATVSANNNKTIGKLITDASKGIKEDGAIITQDSLGSKSSLEITDGLVIEKSYISPYFVTDAEKMVCEYKETFILITEEEISTLGQILPVMKYVKEEGKSLLIIANEIKDEALATLIKNKMEKQYPVAAIITPGVGQSKTTFAEDIATATGATVISGIKGTNLESFMPEMLGSAKSIKIDRDRTIIAGGGADPGALKARTGSIKNMLTKEKQKGAIAFMRERLAKLDGGIAVISIGATTEVELKEKKDLYEDAIAAVKAATEEGVIAGGGSSLAHASKVLKKLRGKNEGEKFGIRVVEKAMREPLKTIMGNAGLQDMNILGDVLKSDNVNYGYNLNEDEFCDMVEVGILDTLKVERLALENSCSVASMMLQTNVSISNELPEKE
ncbi:chaperonin GroEL, partial [bacterium]|nr:chaperonin GroEL [bacterium]